MRVRAAAPTDLDSIAEIERRSFPDPWPDEALRGYFRDPHAVVLVAETEDNPIGFVIARVERLRGRSSAIHIHDLAVGPAHRRQGVGGALVAEVARIARGRGISQVRLEVRIGNAPAQQFYAEHGFRAVRQISRYYEDGEGALRMVLSLGENDRRTAGRGAE